MRIPGSNPPDGALLAACLMALVDRPEGARGYLLDVVAPSEEDATLTWLVKHATAHMAATRHAKLIQTAPSAHPFGRVLRSAGFRTAPARFRTEVKLGWAPVSEAMRSAPPEPAGWSVGYADADTL